MYSSLVLFASRQLSRNLVVTTATQSSFLLPTTVIMSMIAKKQMYHLFKQCPLTTMMISNNFCVVNHCKHSNNQQHQASISTSPLIQHSLVKKNQIVQQLISSKRAISNFTSKNNGSEENDNNNDTNECKKRIKITFVRYSGECYEAYGKNGDTIFQVVMNNELNMAGYGQCDGTFSCSTCHVVFKQTDFDRLFPYFELSEEELDMLDLTPSYTATSRLGCQVFITKEFDGIELFVPKVVDEKRVKKQEEDSVEDTKNDD